MSAAAIRLSPLDNVAVCARTLKAGEPIDVEGIALVVVQKIDLGHKIALSPLKSGDKIVKYGMSIGSATQPVAAGDWVHIHNMQSDYIPAHSRDATGTP